MNHDIIQADEKAVYLMAQTSVNFRMDAELKQSVEEICQNIPTILRFANA